MLDERQAKMKVKEVQKQEKDKRLQKLKSQVTDCCDKEMQSEGKSLLLVFVSCWEEGGGVEGWRGSGVEGFRVGGVEGFRGGWVEGWRGSGIEGWRGGGVEGFRGRGVEGFSGGGVHRLYCIRN